MLHAKKNIKVSSLKSRENEYGSDCTVSNTKFPSVTLNKLPIKARERIV